MSESYDDCVSPSNEHIMRAKKYKFYGLFTKCMHSIVVRMKLGMVCAAQNEGNSILFARRSSNVISKDKFNIISIIYKKKKQKQKMLSLPTFLNIRFLHECTVLGSWRKCFLNLSRIRIGDHHL